MAEFGQLIITDKGSNLIMKTINSNEKICFTGLATSLRRYHDGELKSLSALGDIIQRSGISGIDIESNSTIMIHAVIQNTELTDGYYIKTIGLYADDPDEGEILYAVSVDTSDGGCYVPSYNNRTISNLYFNLSVAVGNSENVQLQIDPGAIVTIRQLGAAEQRVVDTVYQQSTGYTDQKIAELINGAPSTLDTLGEIADAMQDNADVVEALNAAIGTKANQAEMESLLGAINQQFGGLTFTKCTQSQYDALGTGRPSNTIYIIVG